MTDFVVEYKDGRDPVCVTADDYEHEDGFIVFYLEDGRNLLSLSGDGVAMVGIIQTEENPSETPPDPPEIVGTYH